MKNFFSFKAVINKPGVLKYTTNNIPYVGLSAGIPEYNKNAQKTDYINVYVKVYRDQAHQFTDPNCKGAYWFSGKIMAYQDTSGDGKSSTITEFIAHTVEKIEFVQKQYTQPNPNQPMPTGTPAVGPGGFSQNRPIQYNQSPQPQPQFQPQTQNQNPSPPRDPFSANHNQNEVYPPGNSPF